MAYIGREPQIGNFQVCDAISTVNNQAAYTMQVGGVNVSPETANHMLVSLNGILQAPTTSFTVSGSTITFASNLVTGDVINFIQILGSVLDLGVPSDATVSTAKIVDGAVTSAKLASGTGGKVLQVVTATDTTQRSTTSTSFASMTLNATITPAATTSKILVLVQAAMGMNQEAWTFFDIQKSVGGGAYSSLGGSNGFGSTRITSAHLILTPSSLMTLNSPNSTAALTYQVYAKVVNSEDTAYFGDNGTSTMVLMEIGV